MLNETCVFAWASELGVANDIAATWETQGCVVNPKSVLLFMGALFVGTVAGQLVWMSCSPNYDQGVASFYEEETTDEGEFSNESGQVGTSDDAKTADAASGGNATGSSSGEDSMYSVAGAKSKESSESATDDKPQFTDAELREWDAVGEVVTQIIELAQAGDDDENTAVAKTRLLFAVLRKVPGAYSKFGPAILKKLREQLPNSDVTVAAESVVVKNRRAGVADSQFARDVIYLALDYEQSSIPIKMIQRMADDLVQSKQHSTAIRLLQDAIEELKNVRDVTVLRKHLEMTSYTATMMPKFETAPAAFSARLRRHKPVAGKSSKAATSLSSDSSSDRATVSSSVANDPALHKKLIGSSMEFSGQTLDGQTIDVSQYHGKWVVVHFWATWSKTSKKMMPSFVEAKRQSSNLDVHFVSINLDRDPEEVRQYVAQSGLDWPQIFHHGTSDWDTPFVKTNGVRAVPSVFLLDPQGKIIETDLESATLNSTLKFHLIVE